MKTTTILQLIKRISEITNKKERKIEKWKVNQFCSPHRFIQHSINCLFQTSHVHITKKQSQQVYIFTSKCGQWCVCFAPNSKYSSTLECIQDIQLAVNTWCMTQLELWIAWVFSMNEDAVIIYLTKIVYKFDRLNQFIVPLPVL